MMKRILATVIFSTVIFFNYSYPLQAGNLIFFNGGAYEASDKYSVSKDEKGVCLRADNGAFWYLSGDDLKTFKPGDTGQYYHAKNADKPFIITDKKQGFYIEQDLPEEKKQADRSSNHDYEPVIVTKGSDQFYNSRNGDLYITREEVLMGKKGQETLEWEREKAEEEIRKQKEIEAEKQAEAEYRKQQIMLKTLQEAAEARKQAEETKLEIERLRRESESKGHIIIVNDPRTGKEIPAYIRPRNKKRGKDEFDPDNTEIIGILT